MLCVEIFEKSLLLVIRLTVMIVARLLMVTLPLALVVGLPLLVLPMLPMPPPWVLAGVVVAVPLAAVAGAWVWDLLVSRRPR